MNKKQIIKLYKQMQAISHTPFVISGAAAMYLRFPVEFKEPRDLDLSFLGDNLILKYWDKFRLLNPFSAVCLYVERDARCIKFFNPFLGDVDLFKPYSTSLSSEEVFVGSDKVYIYSPEALALISFAWLFRVTDSDRPKPCKEAYVLQARFFIDKIQDDAEFAEDVSSQLKKLSGGMFQDGRLYIERGEGLRQLIERVKQAIGDVKILEPNKLLRFAKIWLSFPLFPLTFIRLIFSDLAV